MSAFLIFFVLAAAVMGSAVILIQSIPKVKRMALTRNLWRSTYDVLSVNIITRRSIRKISSKLSYLSVYRPEEIPSLAARFFLISTSATLLASVAGILLSSEPIGTVMLFIFGFILHDIMTDKQLNKVHFLVLKDSAHMLSVVEQNFLRTKSIPDALADHSEIPKLMRGSIDEIHDIITGANGEMKLQQFIASTPFTSLQTFAGISFNLSVHGDRTDDQGISGFVRAISILRGDINAEIERLTLQKARFGVMEYLPLVSIIAIGPLEGFLVGAIPGLSIMYKSILGFVFRAVTIASSILGYVVISRINSPVTVRPDDRAAWAEWLLKCKLWKRLIDNLVIKKPESRKRITQAFSTALSKMDFRHIYTKKTAFAILLFICTTALLASSVTLGRYYISNTTASLTLAGGAARTEEDEIAIRKMDSVFFASEAKFSDAELKMLIQRYMPKLSSMQIEEEAKRMRDKYATCKDLYFRYWFIFIAFAAGVGGWFLPNVLLKLRARFVRNGAEDDYMQLQTLVNILMYTDMDTLSVLEQLARQSTIHKSVLLWTFHAFPSAPDLEMERLKSKVGLPSFKWFIEKLKLTISELPLREAFSDLIAERDAIMRLRHIAMEATLKKKQTFCSLLAVLPTFLFVLVEFALPLLILGAREYSGTIQNFS